MSEPNSPRNTATEIVDETLPQTGVQFHVHIDQELKDETLATHLAKIGRDILEDTVQALNKWVFSPEFKLTRVEHITIHFLKSRKIKHSATIDGAKAHIYCPDRYFRSIWATDERSITRLIFSGVLFVFASHFNKKSYPDNFILGILNYVSLRKGCFQPRTDSLRTERIWYGKNTMPYFLDFLEKDVGKGTVLRIFAALGFKYDKAIFQKITGKPITDLWKMYRATVPNYEGTPEARGEDWISDLDELWSIPELGIYCGCTDQGHQGHQRCKDFLEIFDGKLLKVLAKAVLAVLRHSGTSKTASITTFELNLSSKPLQSGKALKIKDDENSVSISLDYIFSSKPAPTAKDIMGILIKAFYCLNSRAPIDSRLPKSLSKCKPDPRANREDWTKIMSGHLLLEEGLVPPLTKANCSSSLIICLLYHRDWLNTDVCWHDIVANFFYWIGTTKEATKESVHNLLKQRKYDFDDSCFAELTGETLDALWPKFRKELLDSLRVTHPRAILQAKEYLKQSKKQNIAER